MSTLGVIRCQRHRAIRHDLSAGGRHEQPKRVAASRARFEHNVKGVLCERAAAGSAGDEVVATIGLVGFGEPHRRIREEFSRRFQETGGGSRLEFELGLANRLFLLACSYNAFVGRELQVAVRNCRAVRFTTVSNAGSSTEPRVTRTSSPQLAVINCAKVWLRLLDRKGHSIPNMGASLDGLHPGRVVAANAQRNPGRPQSPIGACRNRWSVASS